MSAFSDHDALRAWLKEQPLDVRSAVIVRIGLRLFPGSIGALRRIHPKSTKAARLGRDAEKAGAAILLPTFRALSAAWALAKYPDKKAVLQIAGTRATAACVKAAPTADATLTLPTNATAAALAFKAAYAAALTATGMEATFVLDGPAERDAVMIQQGFSARSLVGLPIWLGETNAASKDDWEQLRGELLATHKDWRVWTDWYDGRISGSEGDAEFEVARAAVPEEIWEKGPRSVNEHLEQLLAKSGDISDDVNKSAPSDRPEVPKSRPAAVEPIWRDGLLTISRDPVSTDMSPASFANALSALRMTTRDLAEEVNGEANIDRRFVNFINRLAELIPLSTPPRHELFRLGHLQSILDGYAAIVGAEWPSFLAARYHALNIQFDRTMRQSPEWRAFKQNAEKDGLTKEQIEQSGRTILSAVTTLREDQANEFVDPLIPQSLEILSIPLRSSPSEASAEFSLPIRAGLEELGFDLLEGLNNVLKRVAEVALLYVGNVEAGARGAAVDQGKKDGEKIFKWFRRLSLAGAGSLLFALIDAHPAFFYWLQPVINFLRHWVTLT